MSHLQLVFLSHIWGAVRVGRIMSTFIQERDGFLTIYDHYSKKLMMIELYGVQKKTSCETWPDAASAKKAFYAGEFTWDESGT